MTDPELASDLESAADDLMMAIDVLRWLARLERAGKIPDRLKARVRTLMRAVSVTESRLKRFGNDDPDLSKLQDL